MGQKQDTPSASIQAENASHFSRGGVSMVAIPHGSTYCIRLKNSSQMRVDASVSIEASKIGTWRLEAYEELLIELDPSSNARFRIIVGGDIVRVMFKPEKSWWKIEEVEEDRTVFQNIRGETKLVPALSRQNVDWNKVTESTIKFVLS